MKKVQCLIIWVYCLVACSNIDASHTIHSIPPGGITINQPGTYVFNHSIEWSPTSDAVAITIQASNVTLNMQGHTLESTSSVYKTVGISASGSANLKIINGTLKNMGLTGVQCSQCEKVRIERIKVDGLYVDDVITYTVPTGILATQCLNVSIYKCTVKNVNVKTGSLAAIQLTETLASKVTKCRIKNMLNRDGACTGIGHLLCDDATVESCKLDNFRSEFINNLNTEGHTTIGLVPVLSTNLIIKDCEISNIYGCCDDAHGISVFVCVGAIVKRCKVKNVLDGAGLAQTGAKATGIEIYASDVLVSDCYVKNISAINPQDKQATGFSCAVCLGVKFIRCKAKNIYVFDQNGNHDPSMGYGTGFGWAPDPRPEFVFPAVGILYKDCEAKHCQVGFDSWYHIDSVWNRIVSKHNGIAILNQNQPSRTLSCDPCSECGCLQVGCYPNPYSVTLNDIAANNLFKHVKVID